ncbi:MAG TPA: hypothetical protein VLF88_02505 [Candidatus Babeliales bacterium]|nr:hypothetical protein [Candidatus Babeliales bacterium]
MRSFTDYSSNWSVGERTPALSSMQWNLLAIPAAALAIMAILQIISFSKFKDFLESVRIGWPAVVAVALIVAELLGALSLLRIPMHPLARFVGLTLGLLAAGFWFVENLYFATGSGGQLPNSGFFGKYLTQSPGWWTIIEISLLLFWILYAAELFKWRRR